MNENPECEDCELHKRAKHRCLESLGDQDAKLAIFFDAPGFLEDRTGRSFVNDSAEFVKFSLARMSVSLDDVYLDYIVKCAPHKGKLPGKKPDRMACVNACSQYRLTALENLPHLKAICILGSLGSETFLGVKTVGDRAGAEWTPLSPFVRRFVDHIWVGFSPGLLREQPAEAPAIFRVIWKAAEDAGLRPKVNLKLKPYVIQTSR